MPLNEEKTRSDTCYARINTHILVNRISRDITRAYALPAGPFVNASRRTSRVGPAYPWAWLQTNFWPSLRKPPSRETVTNIVARRVERRSRPDASPHGEGVRGRSKFVQPA